MTDENKKIEHRAYARGYAAGRKKVKIERSAEQVRKEKQAFLDKAFLAALPVCLSTEIMTAAVAGSKESERERQVKAAWWFAEKALKQRRSA